MKEVVKEEKRAQIKVQENQKESGMANSQNWSLNLFFLSYTLIFSHIQNSSRNLLKIFHYTMNLAIPLKLSIRELCLNIFRSKDNTISIYLHESSFYQCVLYGTNWETQGSSNICLSPHMISRNKHSYLLHMIH